MNTEQPGPPQEGERVQRDMEWLRVSQMRFCEGYKARMAEPHPMRKNAKGDALNTREPRWSFAELAEEKCPGSGKPEFVTEMKSFQTPRTVVFDEPAWPAHERERWIAGFLHADGIAAERGVAAMERADPSKPPPRAKPPPVVAAQEEEPILLEAAPRLTRTEARSWWQTHRGIRTHYQDAGEQG